MHLTGPSKQDLIDRTDIDLKDLLKRVDELEKKTEEIRKRVDELEKRNEEMRKRTEEIRKAVDGMKFNLGKLDGVKSQGVKIQDDEEQQR